MKFQINWWSILALLLWLYFFVSKLVELNQNTNNSIPSARICINRSGSNNNGTMSKFDLIAQEMYTEAVKPPSSQERTRFSLEKWQRGTGGLTDEDRLTLGELYYKADSVFEFGLGESTYIASHVNVPRFSGVDSDAKWVSDARDFVAAKDRTHFRFYFGDIGKTESFGNPVNENLQKIKYNYQIQALFSEQEPFDVYLVDGRYRVACACMSFLHAMKYGADMEKVRVATHDNNEKGRGYGVVQEIADVEIRNERLWVYKLKSDVTEEDIARIYYKAMNIKTR